MVWRMNIFAPRGISPEQQRAEASRGFEEVLLEERRTLFSKASVREPRSTLRPKDISDLRRMAEYLYEASLKDQYGEYVVAAGADGPRLALRAKVWYALPHELQKRLEEIARHPGRDAMSEPETAQALCDALNALILAGEQDDHRADDDDDEEDDDNRGHGSAAPAPPVGSDGFVVRPITEV